MNHIRHHLAALALLPVGSALLAGCGAMPSQINSTAIGQEIHGRVHGGNQPITNTHIYLFAAGTSADGGPSTSLLNPTYPGVSSDATGAYIPTDSNGNFHIGGAYTCTPGQQIYVLASGGNPGLAPGITNPALKLMSALGQCPSSGTLANTVPTIDITEVSTVAAVYALAGYMTDATHVSSSGSSLSATGIANAFFNVYLLVDPSTGTARSVTPTANGVPPQATINTLANLLTSCVNSTGNSSTCATLFSNAKGLDGSIPADTITAALNIAHNPSANVPALFTLANANPPFQPSLAAAPNDWTLAITFYSDTMAGPYYPAFDAAGDLWVPSYASNTVTEFNSYGAPISGSSGFSGNELNQPYSIAIDSAQTVWVANYAYSGTAKLSHFSDSGSSLNNTPCGTHCSAVALDTGQNLWIAGSTGVTATHYSTLPLGQFAVTNFASGLAIDSTGRGWIVGLNHNLYRLTLPSTVATFAQTATTTIPNDLNQIAIDSADNIWFTSGKGNAIGRADSTGKAISPAGGYKGGGLNYPAQLAIDGSNRVFVANRDGNSISAFNNDGTPISPSTGYKPSSQTPIDPSVIGHTGLQSPHGLAIDPSGNVWVTNFTANSVTVFLGLATPVVTPISPTTHGHRP